MDKLYYSVDDEAAFHLEIIAAIEDNGLGFVKTFFTGDDFIEALRVDCPDVALVDYNLPNSTLDNQKEKLIKRIRIECPAMPIVIISSSKDPNEISRVFNLGVKAWCWKLADDFDEMVINISGLTKKGFPDAPYKIGW